MENSITVLIKLPSLTQVSFLSSIIICVKGIDSYEIGYNFKYLFTVIQHWRHNFWTVLSSQCRIFLLCLPLSWLKKQINLNFSYLDEDISHLKKKIIFNGSSKHTRTGTNLKQTLLPHHQIEHVYCSILHTEIRRMTTSDVL